VSRQTVGPAGREALRPYSLTDKSPVWNSAAWCAPCQVRVRAAGLISSVHILAFEARRQSSGFLRRHDQRQVGLVLGNDPNAMHLVAGVVDDLLPFPVVVNRPHGAVGKLTMADDRIEFH
jgi:hypothetical protein